jgi:hypothetical protein
MRESSSSRSRKIGSILELVDGEPLNDDAVGTYGDRHRYTSPSAQKSFAGRDLYAQYQQGGANYH